MNLKKYTHLILVLVTIMIIAAIDLGAMEAVPPNTVAIQAKKIPDISGKWTSSIGVIYQITQQGNSFSWLDTKSNIKASGTIQGDKLTAEWMERRTKHSINGRITEYDSSGRPIKIVWSDEVIFTRESRPQIVSPIEGWCCKDGDVFATTITQCNKQGGQFFRTREEAEDHCRGDQPIEGWCCLEGSIFPSTEAACPERGGRFFRTREAAEEFCQAMEPEPERGFCCREGKVFPSSIEECLEQGGQFFRTREEAEDHCRGDQPIEGWCCLEGSIFPSTEAACHERGGRFFHAREAAEEFCRSTEPEPERGFCCLEGKVFPSSIDECLEQGGQFFRTREEAEEHCRGDQPIEGWCCLEGAVFPSTGAACDERGGRFFHAREAAEEFCRSTEPEPERGFCCLEGKVFPASIEECLEQGGQFFRTREEAEEFCGKDRLKPEHGWCCRDGEVFPAASEGCCRELGGRFFASREEAEEFCRGERPEPEDGFCCREGRIFPTRIDECQEQGGRFFRAREEAERYCRPAMPDLIIQEMVVAPKRLRAGEEVVVRAAIRNMGNYPAQGISILFVGRDQREHEMARANIEHLEPGQSEDVTINRTAQTPGDWLITAIIDPENRILEWNERNNDATGVCLVEEPIAAKKPVQTEEMAATTREVQTLEQPHRGAPDPAIPRRSDKISDVRPELMAIKYNATYKFGPKEEKSFPFEITVPAIILIKVFILEGQPEEFSILINQEGHDQQVWPKIGTQQGELSGYISEMVEITPEKVVQGKNWTLKLLNHATQPLKAEVSIGTIDRDRH